MSPSEKCISCDRGSCPGCEPTLGLMLHEADNRDPVSQWFDLKGPKL